MTASGSRPDGGMGRLPATELQTVVINLDRRPDRLEAFQTRLRQAAGAEFAQRCRRLAAIDGGGLVDTPELRHLFRANRFDFRRGVIGCALSHLELWRAVGESDDDQLALVFEDDALPADAFDRRLADALEALPREYPRCGLGFLGYHLVEGAEPSDPAASGRWRPMRWERWLGGSFAYLLSPRAARTLASRAEREGIQDPIDLFLSRHQADLDTLEYDPPLVSAPLKMWWNAVDSDVQADAQPL